MKKILTAAGAALAANCLTLTAAFAMGRWPRQGGGRGGGQGNGGGPHDVPEIDAGTGLLALAAVAAALILAWEVNRRRRA